MNTVSTRSRGFTLIEMMVALAALAIVVVFATPVLQNNAARSDMKEATDQIAQAFLQAKNAARINNSNVRLTLTTNEMGNRVTFAFDNGSSISDSGQMLPAVVLPETVSVITETPEFVFSRLGVVNTTGSIALVSTARSELSSTVAINTLMGHAITSFDSLNG